MGVAYFSVPLPDCVALVKLAGFSGLDWLVSKVKNV